MSAESEHVLCCSSGIIKNVTLTHDAAQLVALHGAELVGVQRNPAEAGEAVPVPAGLAAPLRDALMTQGITTLYRHQLDAVAAVFRGESVLLTTGTASGKSLAYQWPALSRQLARPDATALVLYPTKALAHDQARSFAALSAGAGLPPAAGASYDGDTPAGRRPQIRANVRTLITNPDMLNAGILPHHTLWSRFLKGLSLIVVDEIHTYRGIFGSHVAGVLRRLLRLARHYGAEPKFVLTSATLGNPVEHAQRLTGLDVRHIDRNAAPHAGSDWLIVQPPIVDSELGIRRPALQEAMSITERLVEAGSQVLLVCGSRPAVAQAVMAGYPGSAAAFRQQAGRAGRRETPGTAVLVLGGGPLDQYLASHPQNLFGAPSEQALTDPDHLLIALDHLRCATFELPLEAHESFGRFGPDEVQLLLGQLQEDGQVHLAAGKAYWVGQDYPAQRVNLRSSSDRQVSLIAGGQTIGTVDGSSARWLVHEGAIYLHDGLPYLVTELNIADSFATLEPADNRYLTRATTDTRIEPADGPLATEAVKGARKFSGDVIVTETVTGYRRLLRQTLETIGRYPLESEPATLFTSAYGWSPAGAVVERLRQQGDWSNDANDYGPDWPRLRRQIVARDGERCQVCNAHRSAGVVLHVHHKVPFRAFASAAQANQPDNLITLCPSCHRRAEQGVRVRSGLAAVSYVVGSLAPLLVMCDRHDLGVHSDPASPLAGGAPALVIFEVVPGGIGLTAELAARHDELLAAARGLILDCRCESGCPSCVGPAGEEGHAGKQEALALLRMLT